MKRSQRKQSKRARSSKTRQFDFQSVRSQAKQYLSLLSGVTPDAATIRSLKSEPIPVINYIAKRLADKPRARRGIVGNPLPKTYEQLAGLPPFRNFVALEPELSWQAATFQAYTEQLNSFLDLKRQFETAYMRRELSNSRKAYEAIIAIFGYSLWSIGSGFLLAEAEGGLEVNRRFLSELQESIQEPFTVFLAQLMSQRVEKGMSTEVYDSTIASLVQALSRSAGGRRLADYFRLNHNFHSYYQYSPDQLSYSLCIQNKYALIDRYLTTVRVLQLLACDKSMQLAWLSIARSVLPALKDINDPCIQLLLLLSGPHYCSSLTHHDHELLALIDCYTAGDYHSARAMALHGLSQNPDSFEYYDLYLKACIHSQAPIALPFEHECFVNDILVQCEHVLRKDNATRESLRSLLKYSRVLDGTRIGAQLHAFYLHQRHPRSNLRHDTLAGITSSSYTPRFAALYEASSDARDYLTFLRRKSQNSPAVRLFTAVSSPLPDEAVATLSASLPETRLMKYQAQILHRSGQLDAAATLYDTLAQTMQDSPLAQYDALSGLTDCYLRGGRLEFCARRIVEAYLLNKNLVNGLPLLELVRAYETFSPTQREHGLHWPILYWICYEEGVLPRDLRRLYTEYDTLLASLGVERPSQLTPILHTLPRKQLVVFLRYVCIPDVMDSSIAYKSTSDVEAERIGVCKLLLTLDEPNAAVFADEIYRLTQADMVRRAVRHVEERKVFIDTPGIKQTLDQAFVSKVERYRLISQLQDERIRRILLPDYLSPDKMPRIVTLNDASFELFKELFNELKTRFISSNEYGLDSYLSVRIRHGTLSGQLRSPFDSSHLITRRESDEGGYHRNKYWMDRLSPVGDTILAAVDQELRKFSEMIDKTIDRVKSCWLQIKGIDHSEGLFDFTVSIHAPPS
jgi:hypothetical protein